MRDDLIMICFQMRDRRYMNFRNNEQMYRSLGMNVGKHPDLGIFKNSFRFKRAASNFTKKTIHDCNSFEKNPSVILNTFASLSTGSVKDLVSYYSVSRFFALLTMTVKIIFRMTFIKYSYTFFNLRFRKVINFSCGTVS